MVQMTEVELDKLSVHVAELVEQRLLAKAMRLLAANLVVMLGIVATGFGAYFTLLNEVRENRSLNNIQDRRIDQMYSDTSSFRAIMDGKLDQISSKMDSRFDELNRYLRDLNSVRTGRAPMPPQ